MIVLSFVVKSLSVLKVVLKLQFDDGISIFEFFNFVVFIHVVVIVLNCTDPGGFVIFLLPCDVRGKVS
jgi:hypothetical protein